MKKNRLFIIGFFAVALIAAMGIPTKPQLYVQNGDEVVFMAGRNVNMVSGTTLPDGDPYLQRQNEPSLAVSSRNPMHLLAGSNDYRTVDMPIVGEQLPGIEEMAAADAWVSYYTSDDGGESWKTSLLPGFPQDTSTVGMESPLKAYSTAADPHVIPGTKGRLYYSGLAFNRNGSGSAIFVARFEDTNDKETGNTIYYRGNTIVATGNAGQFLDMPSTAVDIPRGASNDYLFLAYTVFLGNLELNVRSRIMFTTSTDGGLTWSNPIKLSESQHIIQCPRIAIDPENGDVYVVFRRFYHKSQDSGIIIVKSTDRGQTFSSPEVVTPFLNDTFDQPATANEVLYPDPDDYISGESFRTNSYATIAVGKNHRVFVAYAQRGLGNAGEARIVLRTGVNGSNWDGPYEVGPMGYDPETGRAYEEGYQFMPQISISEDILTLVWYDQHEDWEAIAHGFGDWISDFYGTERHVIDVCAGQVKVPFYADHSQWSFTQVSRYLYALALGSDGSIYYDGNGNPVIMPVQFNCPNLPLNKGGMLPFIGDYIAIAPSKQYKVVNGNWQFNTEPSGNHPIFHVAWTDNRDVRAPTGSYDWTNYVPVSPDDQPGDFISPGREPCSGNVGNLPAIRNQNVYTAKLSLGVLAASPSNEKDDDLSVARSFVVYVKNNTKLYRSFLLTINPLSTGFASFFQFGDPVTELEVVIAPFSTISRQVYIDDTDDPVRIDIEETDASGAIDPEGLKSYVIINGDPSSDGVSGTEETHQPIVVNPENPNIVNWVCNPNIVNPNIVNPNIVNPNIVNPNIVNPNIVNPNIVNPNIVNPNIVNPNIVNPNIVNPNIVNPNIVNPNIVNPNIVNPNIVNTTDPDAPAEADITDVVWTVKNDGNTTTAYTLMALTKKSPPPGVYTQLLVYRTHYTPAVAGEDLSSDITVNTCEVKEEPSQELILNIVNPNIVNPNIVNPNIVNPNIVNPNIVNPNIVNSSILDTTFSLAPGEEAYIDLRVMDTEGWTQSSNFVSTQDQFSIQAFDVNEFISSIGFVVTSLAVDSEDAAQGITTPKGDATDVYIVSSDPPDGVMGTQYNAYMSAFGGTRPYTWELNSGVLPPGLFISTYHNPPYYNDLGLISGMPTMSGTYSFVVQVTDAEGKTDIQLFSITIHETSIPDAPIILTSSPLPSGVTDSWYGVAIEVAGGDRPLTWSWSGTTPELDGLTLDPLSGIISGTPLVATTYTFDVTVTDRDGQFATSPFVLDILESTGDFFIITGTVYDDSSNPLDGVQLYGLPNSPITDSNGYYEDYVPAGWSGTVIPFKLDHFFTPENRVYVEVDAHQYGQNYNQQEEWYATQSDVVRVTDMVVDSFGNAYVSGCGNTGAYVAKYDNTGTFQWDFRYGSTAEDLFYGLSVDPDGNVYATGEINHNILTVKHDPDGNHLWSDEYDSSYPEDGGHDIAIDVFGNFYVTGWAGTSTPSIPDACTIKYKQSGGTITREWVNIYDDGDHDYGLKIAIDPEGDIIVAGYNASPPYDTHDDIFIIKYSTFGAIKWNLRYDGGISQDYLHDMCVDAAGNVYVTGRKESGIPNSADYLTVKFDSSGTFQWKAEYDGAGNQFDDIANAITVDADGYVYVTGRSGEYVCVPHPTDPKICDDYATIKYDPSGNPMWTPGGHIDANGAARYDGAPGGDHDVAEDIEVDPFGNVYVTGRSVGNDGSFDFATLIYDSSGVKIWEDRYNNNSRNDEAQQIELDPEGNIFVSGPTGADLLILKYGQNFPTTLSITTEALPNGVQGTAYNAVMEAFGGTGSYSWSISYGSLPDGLYIDNPTGVIFGTPTTPGTYNFDVLCQDGSLSDTKSFIITVPMPMHFIRGTILATPSGYIEGAAVTFTTEGGGSETVYSGTNGVYMNWVPYGWTGTVTTSMEGHVFLPEVREYTNVTANFEMQSFTSVRYWIRGTILATPSGYIEGAAVTFTTEGGGSETVYSGTNGVYSNYVPLGWTGTVTTSMEGHVFLPEVREYTNVTANFEMQSFTSVRYWIRGTILATPSGYIEGAAVTFTTEGGGSETVYSGTNGVYSNYVPLGWTGTVTTSMAGYNFSPAFREYTNVTANQEMQSFTGTPITFIISGTVSTNPGLDGVTMLGLPGDPMTSGGGLYSASVPFGWSGTVTPTLAGYSFDPPFLEYTNVDTDYPNQNFTATVVISAPFTKITTGAVVMDGGDSVGCAWGDYDDDGDLDLFVANGNAQNNFLYTNNGDGSFTAVTDGAVVTDEGWSSGCAWGDYDNDGDLDLFVANSSSENNFLYANNGNGTFTAVTTGVVVTDGGTSIGCAWGDYDNDGDLDLFVTNSSLENNFLYTNNGNGTFAKVMSGAVVQDIGYFMDCAWGDYDNDGDLDLFVANQGPDNFLYTNNGDGSFSKVTSGVLVEDGGASYSCAWGDYDNDGDLDLFVANSLAENNFLYTNNGSGSFTEVTLGAVVQDGEDSRGGTWGDYDNDGDLDLFVANLDDQNNSLYVNNGNSNNWINIECAGVASNVSAIGSKVKVNATIGGDSIWQLLEISGGTGSQDSLNTEFGLGEAAVIDEIQVLWPSGQTQVLPTVAPNQFLTITEPLLPAPTVTSVNPATGTTADDTLNVTISGLDFYNGAIVELNFNDADPITATGVTFVSGSELQCVFDLTGVSDHLGEAWDIKVTNPGGTFGIGEDLFTIYIPGPTVSSIDPNTGTADVTYLVTITGTNFVSGASVKLTKGGEADIDAIGVSVDSDTQITCSIDLTGAAVGAWDVVVTVPGAESPGTLPGGFTVSAPSTFPEINISYDETNIADGGSYYFGSQPVGTDTDVIFTIENLGTGELTITTPSTIGGTDSDQFSVPIQPSSSVSSGDSTTFTIRFSPTSEGIKSASIAIENNDTDESPYNIAFTGTAGPPTAPAWAKTYGASDGDEAYSFQQTSDSGFIVAGETYSFGAGISDLLVMKLDSDGGIEWQKAYGGPDFDDFFSIQETTDSGFIVAGNTLSFGAGSWDLWVMKLDSAGDVLWQKTYGGPSYDEFYSIQETSDSGFIVAGSTGSFGAGSSDSLVLKLDSMGAVVWQKTYGGPNSDMAHSIQQTSDSGFIVAGSTGSFGAGGYDSWVLKLDSAGDVLWQKTYGGSNNDYAYSIQQTSDSGFIVAGVTGSDVWVLKLDSAGDVLWQKTYGGSNSDIAHSIQQTSDSGFIVVGYTNSFGAGAFDIWVLKLDSAGDVLWQKTYGGSAGDDAHSIQQTSDSGYIVAGLTGCFGAGGYDFWVLKLNPNGSIDPSCSPDLGADSTAIPASTSVTPATSTATAADSTATITDTSVTPTDTSAVIQTQCMFVGLPHQLAFSQQPSDTAAGSTITPAVTVEIQDQWGNLVTTATDAVTLSLQNAGGATLDGTTSKAAVGGIATFDDLSIDEVGTGYFLRANSGSLTEVDSIAFQVTAPATFPEINVKQGSTDIADGGSYDFGSQAVGTDTFVGFGIGNSGNADLTISLPITISGPDADQFSVETEPPSIIAPTLVGLLGIKFSPTTEGTKSASIAIGNNDSDENPYDITMTGTATPPSIATFAGNGIRTWSIDGEGGDSTDDLGDGGAASSATFRFPIDATLDSSGNIYIADMGNGRIRKIDAITNVITTYAGGGSPPDGLGDGGLATDAALNYPRGLAFDSQGNLFIADSHNLRIRRIDANTGVITTYAGGGSPPDGLGDGGPATSAYISYPYGVAVDSSDNVYIADNGNQRIRKVDALSSIITTVAGNGTITGSVDGEGGDPADDLGDGGPATSATLYLPYDIALDAIGNLFIADKSNHRIRRVDSLSSIITTVAGNGTITGSVDGEGGDPADDLGDGGPATSATLNNPTGVFVDFLNNLFISDRDNHRVRKIYNSLGNIFTLAGTGVITGSIDGEGGDPADDLGDGGPATSATLNSPYKIALDASGSIFIADFYNYRIRKVIY